MAELAVVPIQVEPNLQTEAESIFRELGYSVSEAIALFYQQVILNKGFPFRARVPNQTTLDTFRKTDACDTLVRCQNADELFESLGI
jgi:DNA-damage-inducible protein J